MLRGRQTGKKKKKKFPSYPEERGGGLAPSIPRLSLWGDEKKI